MDFINNSTFKHYFYKDVTRINYFDSMPLHLINDYGYSYIMIRYGNIKAFNYKGKEVNIPNVFIKGTGDYFTVKAHKDSSWISFEMPNHIIHNVTNIDSKKSRNTFIDLSQYVENEVVESLYIALRHENSIEKITKIADQHLSTFYSDWNTLLPSVEIVQYIFNKKGLLSVKDLSKLFPYSERSLERMFYKEVGTSPHRFICLVRFNYIIREVESQGIQSLPKLIEKYNYFDHSHFNKDLKKFLGHTINSYKNSNNPLLTNGLSRKYFNGDKPNYSILDI